MSYGVKYRCTHKAETNGNVTTYEIEILKLNYTGSITEVIGWEETFFLEYDRVNVREPFKTPLNNARLEFYLAVRNSSDLTVLTEIFTSDEDEYQLRLKQNTNVIWTGWILKDLLQYSEGDYPYRGTIIAKDLTRLSQYTFPLADDRQKLIVTIADLLDDLGLGLDIYTYTNWTNDAFTGSDDFLNLTYHETRALRDYKESGDEDDTTQTNEFWLDALLRNFGLIIRQANGAWRIYQLSGMTDATSIEEYRYNSAGVKQSGTTADLSTTIDSNNRFLLPTSANYVLPGIKQANVLWDHRTPVSGIQFPDIKIFTGAGSETYSQFFTSDGTPEIQLRFQVQGVFDTSVSTEDLYAEYDVFVETTGSDYYLQDDGTWDTTANSRRVNLRYSGGRSQGSTDFVAIGSVSFTSGPVPTQADGTLKVILYSAPSADSTTYRSFEFEILNNTAESDSDSLAYSLTQTENYSYIYDHGTVYYGDGPTDYADSALRYGVTNSELTSDGWKRVGDVTSRNLFDLLLREFVDLQADGLRLIEAEILGYYQPNQMLVYEATDFFMLGGSLTGNNVWRIDFLGVGYSVPTVNFSEAIRKLTNSAFAGNATNFLAERSASFEEKQYITITTSSLTGTITSIPVEAVSFPVGKVGDPIYLFNVLTGIVDEFTLAETYRAGAISIVVESGAVTGTVPEGSWIVYTGERISSYITQTDSAITLGVRSADVALLSDDSIFTNEAGDEYYFVEGDYTGQIIRSEALINIRADQILAQVSAIVGEDLTVLNDIVDDIAQLQTDVSQNDAAIGSLQTTVSALPTAVEFAALEASLEINTDSILLGVREFSYALFSDNDEFITADGDTFAFVDNGDVIGLIRYNESLINVESDRIDLKVREIGSATAIGVLSTARTGGNTYTQILLDDRTLAQDISLRDGDNLRLFNDAGQSEQVTINGDQTITKGNSSIQTITIDSKTLQNTYAAETSHLSFPGYQLGSEINVLKDEIVLKVDSNGDIAFIRLDGSADAGTEITINADQITVAGQTTFLSALGSEGFPTVSGINVTIRSATAPTIRTSGDALVTGDLWIETDNGDKPYTWNGTAWVAQYTVIDGGNITTGTIDASVVTVTNLNASNISTGTLSADRIGANSIDATKIDVSDLFAETITVDAAGSLQSSNYVADTSGFLIEGSGDAEFNSVTIRNGTVINSIDRGSFGSGNTGVQIVSDLNSITSPVEGEIAFLTTDNKLYRYDGTQWTSAVPAVDITGEITETQISDNSISTPKLQANAVTANEIAANTITANEIAANTITANEILAGTITAAEIATNTITANEIAAGTITATEIAASTITANELNVSTLSAISADVGTLTAGTLTGGSMTIDLDAGSITSDVFTLESTNLDISSADETIEIGATTRLKMGKLSSTLFGLSLNTDNYWQYDEDLGKYQFKVGTATNYLELDDTAFSLKTDTFDLSSGSLSIGDSASVPTPVNQRTPITIPNQLFTTTGTYASSSHQRTSDNNIISVQFDIEFTATGGGLNRASVDVYLQGSQNNSTWTNIKDAGIAFNVSGAGTDDLLNNVLYVGSTQYEYYRIFIDVVDISGTYSLEVNFDTNFLITNIPLAINPNGIFTSIAGSEFNVFSIINNL